MAFYLTLFSPPAIAILMLFWLLARRSWLALFGCLLACFLSLVLWGGVAWLFKDGLAPGVVPSQGAVAVYRFSQVFAVPFAILVGIGAVAVFVYRKHHGEDRLEK